MNRPSGLATVSPAMPDAVNYHRWIMGLVAPRLGKTVLEVGIGQAQYSRAWIQPGREFMAVDFDAECVEIHRAAFPEARAEIADLSNDGFIDVAGRNRFDSIICLNVLEHLEDDRGALERLSAVLREGGELLLLVPAHPALFGRMDEIAGHYRRYERRGLGKLLKSAGFEVPVLRYLNPLGGLGWWANSRFYRPKDLSDSLVEGQVRFFDRYVQPVSRLVDPLTAAFFGQSLWAVARRARSH